MRWRRMLVDMLVGVGQIYPSFVQRSTEPALLSSKGKWHCVICFRVCKIENLLDLPGTDDRCFERRLCVGKYLDRL